MATRRTKEEKLKLIADYEASGLSMTEWCTTNSISKSTFVGWICNTKADVITPKSKAKFVEVTPPTGLQEQPEPQARNTADITVEYKAFKITIPANVDIRTLENILKVVLQARACLKNQKHCLYSWKSSPNTSISFSVLIPSLLQ